MRDNSNASLGLTGALLVAHPDLLDPNFRRTVLYMGLHDSKNGAFGLILNRPMNKTVEEFLPLEDMGALADVPVYFGGPVARDQITFACFNWDEDGDVLECHLHMDISDARIKAEYEPQSIRAFVGYAGWSEGQLESELSQHSWIVQPAMRELLDSDKCNDCWHWIVRSLGPWFQLLAEAPDDPTLN